MTDAELLHPHGPGPPSEQPPSTSAEISFDASNAEGAQHLPIEQRKLDLQAQTAAHKQLIERTKLDHELSEARKDSDARRDREARRAAEELARDRLVFRLTITGIALGLVAGCIAGFVIQDEFTQRWGQGLITLIIGGLVGYFTGRHVGD